MTNPVGVRAVCSKVAGQQFGLIHRHQALAAGMSPRAIKYRIKTGEWEVTRHNVYRFEATPKGWHQDLFALHLWSSGGLAAGRSAAALYQLRSFKQGPLEVCVSKELDAPDGVVVARMSPGFDLEHVLVQDVPCTTLELTIVRLAATVGVTRTGIALDDALRRRMTTLKDLNDVVEGFAIQGRNDIRRTRTLIEARDKRSEQVRGESENEMLPLFDGVRLPVAEVDYEITVNGRLVALADFAYPSARLDIEADTHSFHDAQADAERDKRRDRRLALLGWTTLRFTRREIQDEPDRVVRDIQAHLRRIAPELLVS